MHQLLAANIALVFSSRILRSVASMSMRCVVVRADRWMVAEHHVTDLALYSRRQYLDKQSAECWLFTRTYKLYYMYIRIVASSKWRKQNFRCHTANRRSNESPTCTCIWKYIVLNKGANDNNKHQDRHIQAHSLRHQKKLWGFSRRHEFHSHIQFELFRKLRRRYMSSSQRNMKK